MRPKPTERNAIELPWPPKELSPNARVHHMAKAPITRHYREAAYWRTTMGGHRLGGDGPVHLDVTFHPPDKRRRDLDGMFSSCKAAFDGIADAMCINDQLFEFTLRRAEPVKNGKVLVQIQ